MTTIIVDDDMKWVELPPRPGFVPPTISVLLAEKLDAQTCFYICDGKPMAVWPEWDYAENWSVHPICEVHPFHPIIHGKEITEEEFRRMVKAIHELD